MPKLVLKFNAYEYTSRAVESGVAYGWRRAHKHTDKPGEEAIREAIQDAVMQELSELIAWDDPETGVSSAG